MKKTLLASIAMMALVATPALADGDTKVTEKEVCTTTTQYGGATNTDCKKEQVTEEVTHKTVDAGLGDYPLAAIAFVTSVAAGALYATSVAIKRA
jgi:hypothetical protein